MNAPTNTKDSKAVATFEEARLPYHRGISERFGIDRSGWRVLVEATFPAAKSIEAVVMALAYCKQRNLDVFKRPVHIVPMWSASANNGKGGYVETVWPGIAELRTTAFRTGQYAGCDAVEFGPDKISIFKGTKEVWEGPSGSRYKTEQPVETEVTYPEWGAMTVWRMIEGVRVAFHGPRVYWLETYGRRGKTDLPNEMWAKRPRGQLEKCVEAAALRKAFPEEIGNELTADEMAGQTILEGEAEVVPKAVAKAPKVPPAPAETIVVEESYQGRTPPEKDPEAGIPDHMRSEHDVAAEQPSDPFPEGPVQDSEHWKDQLIDDLAKVRTSKGVDQIQLRFTKEKKGMFPGDVGDVERAIERARRRVEGELGASE